MSILATLNNVEEFALSTTLKSFIVERLNISAVSDTSKDFQKFLETSVILVFKSKKFDNNLAYEKHIKKIHNGSKGQTTKHIQTLVKEHLQIADKDAVEIKGIEKNPNVVSQNFNITLKYLVSQNFEKLLQIIGEETLRELLKTAIFLYKEQDIYVQLTGKSLQLLYDRPKPIQTNTKYKGKKVLTDEQILKSIVDRNSFLYCLHSNKKVDFFHKSPFYVKKMAIKKKKSYYKNRKDVQNAKKIIEDAKDGLYDIIFGSYSPNAATKEQLCVLLSKVMTNYQKINLDKLYRYHCPYDGQKVMKLQAELEKLKENVKNTSQHEDIQKRISEMLGQLTRMTVDELQIVRFLKAAMHSIFPPQYFGHVKKKDKEKADSDLIDPRGSKGVRLMQEELELSSDVPANEEQEIVPVRINHYNNIKRETKGILNYYLKKLICMKRFESFTYLEILQELKFNKLDWYMRKFNKFFKADIHKERNTILTRLIYFYFNCALDLIKANFYATEKHSEHNKLFYYAKPVWYLISQYGTLQMEIENLSRIRDQSQLTHDKLLDRPIAKLRFVPKNDSLRPIMTFYRRFRDTKTNKTTRMQHYLMQVKIVLRSVKLVLSRSFGFSVFDNHQIFAKLEPFIEQWKSKSRPFLYCASLDIKKCYDSVNLTKMFDFVKTESIFQQIYLINNFFKIIRNKRYYFGDNANSKKMANLFLGKKRDTSNVIDELQSLSTFFKDKIILPDKTIFCDSGTKFAITKQEILDKLWFVCENVFVKFGKSYFELNRGLPQGLSVSSVLSSFYYSLLEYNATKDIMEEFEQAGTLCLIMRLTDDYIILTESASATERIVQRLLECADNHGFEFNKKKLKANFKFHKDFHVEEDPYTFKWIGKTFDLKKMEVEHTQIMEKHEAFYTVNVNLPSQIKMIPDFLKGKLKTFFLNQNTFYFNSKVNSDDKIKALLPKIITSAYYKLSTYLNMLSYCSGYEACRTPIYLGVVSNKLLETIIDCSYIVQETSHNMKVLSIANIMLDKIIDMLKIDCDNKIKYILRKQLQLRKKALKKKSLRFYE